MGRRRGAVPVAGSPRGGDWAERPGGDVLAIDGKATRRLPWLMILPYRPERVDEAGLHFAASVGRIRVEEFLVTTPPEAAICRECDLRVLCRPRA